MTQHNRPSGPMPNGLEEPEEERSLTGEMSKLVDDQATLASDVRDYNERDLKEHAELRMEVASVHTGIAAVGSQVLGVKLEVAEVRTELAKATGKLDRVVEIVDEERAAKTLAIQDAAHAKKATRDLKGKVIGGLIATFTAAAGFIAHALSH